ncbi:MAG: phosphate/phosphite/phosphonate ABC transporter substrate-binding protein [Spirochaetales bacterium]|nr:phosphate/phosphite/phosphonate ABC transporter substrate-binding protein [Spirochaetales bacterium]
MKLSRCVSICMVTCSLLASRVFAQESAALRFGVYPIYDAKTTIRIFQPLADYLAEATGREVRLVSADSGQAFLERAMAGSYDLVWGNFVVYLKLHEAGIATAVARGTPPFRGMAVVSRDSPYRSVHDLAGTRIVAVSRESLAGYLFLARMLENEGLDIDTDATVTFAPRVESIPFLVDNGKADVGVYVEDLYQRSPAYDQVMTRLRVIARSPPIPQFPFAVSLALDTPFREALGRALGDLDGSDDFERTFLRELRIDRVERADDASYDEFRAYYLSVTRPGHG